MGRHILVLVGLILVLALVATPTAGNLFGWGQNWRIGRGSQTASVTSSSVLPPNAAGKTISKVGACGKVNFFITSDGLLFLSGVVGDYGITYQSLNVSAPNFAGRVIVDAACGLKNYLGSVGLTRFLVSMDDYTVFYFDFSSSYVSYDTSIWPYGFLWTNNPTQITFSGGLNGLPVKALRSGGDSLAVLFEHGIAVVWGSNVSGKLGFDPIVNATVNSPTEVSLPNQLISDLSFSEQFTLICTSSGIVFGAGANSAGQLMRSTTTTYESTWMAWSLPLSSARCLKVFTTSSNSFVLTSIGKILTVGSNNVGQLGVGSTIASSTIQTALFPPALRVRDFAVGENEATGPFALAITYNLTSTARSIFGWGSVQAAGLTGPWRTTQLTPVPLNYLRNDIGARYPTNIFASYYHALLEADSGVFITWSLDGTGPAGYTWSNPIGPALIDTRNIIPTEDSIVILRSAPVDDKVWTYAYLSSGKLFRWGYDQMDPVEIVNAAGLDTIVDIAVGIDFAIFRTAGGAAWTHGMNSYYQLGSSAAPGSIFDTLQRVNTMANIVSIAALRTAGLAVINDGTMLWWGTWPASSTFGSWVSPVAGTTAADPVAWDLSLVFNTTVPQLDSVWSAPNYPTYLYSSSATLSHTIFVRARTGDVFSLGENYWGQLCAGLPYTTRFSSTFLPVTLPDGLQARKVATGAGYTYILANNGSLFSCGLNSKGQLSIGSQYAISYAEPANANNDPSYSSPMLVNMEEVFFYSTAQVEEIVAGSTGCFVKTSDGLIFESYSTGLFRKRGGQSFDSRRIKTIAAGMSYTSYAVAPMEIFPSTSDVPSTSPAITIIGRGFSTSVDKITVTLSESNCTPKNILTFYPEETIGIVCEIWSPQVFTVGTVLTVSVTVDGETATQTWANIIAPPTVSYNTSNLVSGASGALTFYGSGFGSQKDIVSATVMVDGNTNTFECYIQTISDSEIRCNINYPPPRFDSTSLIMVQVTRLGAVSTPKIDSSSTVGLLLPNWNLVFNSKSIPRNMRVVSNIGDHVVISSDLTLGNMLEYWISNGSDYLSQVWNKCPQTSGTASAERRGDVFYDVVSCVGVDLSQVPVNYDFFLRLTRGGYTSGSMRVGSIVNALEPHDRAAGARLNTRAAKVRIPITPLNGTFNYYETIDLSTVMGTLFVVNSSLSTKRATAGIISAGCFQFALESRSNNVLTCDTTLYYAPEPLADGSVYLNLSIPAFDFVATTYIGETTTDATVTASTKKIARNAEKLYIYGSGFADGQFAKSDNEVLFNGYPNSFICPIIEANSTLIVCNMSSYQTPGDYGGPFYGSVRSWGNLLASTQLGSIANLPSINGGPFDYIAPGQVDIFLNGSDFAENPAENYVEFAEVVGSGDERNFTWVPCLINVEHTNATFINCTLTNKTMTSEAGRNFRVRVYANGGMSKSHDMRTGDNNNGGFGRDESGPIIGIVVGVIALVLIVLVILIVLVVRRNRRVRDIKSQLTQVPKAMASMFNIKSESLEIEKKLGEGSFGAVFLAKFKTEKGVKRVAVKKLTSSMLSSNVDAFFREATLMMSIPPHVNVVKIYGLCQEMNNFSLVMEFLAKGSLDSYTTRVLGVGEWSPVELYRIAIGIARGMAHLAASGIVHRDLAARNILLSANAEPKVSDFGMSRVLGTEGTGQTSSNVGPIRWMSPENIRDKAYSEKSDVWSYGVLLFEVLSGKEPYPDEDLLAVAVSIRDTGRNPMELLPPDAPKYLRDVMHSCFALSPDDRPHFADIVKVLEKSEPHGYTAPVDSDDETAIATVGGVKDNKSKKGKHGKKGKKRGKEDDAVEMEEHEAAPATHYGALSTPNASAEGKFKESDNVVEMKERKTPQNTNYGAIMSAEGNVAESAAEKDEKSKDASDSSDSSSSD